MEKWMGIDYGMARTGIAVSDDLFLYAHSVGNVRSYTPEMALEGILEKINELHITRMVIGKPLRTDGKTSEKVEAVNALVAMLKEKTDVPIDFWDERFTTVLAHQFLSDSGMKAKKHRQVVDSVAAEIILQDYMDAQKAKTM